MVDNRRHGDYPIIPDTASCFEVKFDEFPLFPQIRGSYRRYRVVYPDKFLSRVIFL
jgi:hypothetical protein